MSSFLTSPRQEDEEIPISVMVLGFPESGKTVLLATMYHQLCIPGGAGFRLSVEDPAKHNKLVAIYERVADPNKEFPDPSVGSTTWEVIGSVKSSKHHNLLKFTYSDYSGELVNNLLKEEYTPFDTEFLKTLQEADVLLSILDGQKVLQVMKGVEDKKFYKELQMMLKIMTDRDKPVHFILTKWDLLHGKYTLEKIIQRLEEIFEPFRQFLASHATPGLRLIPVSSVGMKFVREENGAMKKITNAHIRPFQVKMPIACILPDLIEARKKEGSQSWIARVFRFYLSKASFSVGIGVLAASIDQPFENGDTTSKKLEEEKLPGPHTIRNKKDALKYVYCFFAIIVDILEFDFPASNITRLKNVTKLKEGHLP